jgi:uncharacterized protein (DUF362 family)
MKDDVFIAVDSGAVYPAAPFHPGCIYSEFNGFLTEVQEKNCVYEMVRNLFLQAGYDDCRKGTDKWNPFRGMVADGDTVFVKPNLVQHETRKNIDQPVIVTHASVLRPILDYLCLLQKQDGLCLHIVIGDVPIQGADFEVVAKQTGLTDLVEFYRSRLGVNIAFLDLRREIAVFKNDFIEKIIPGSGDPKGYSSIHVGDSYLNEISDDHHRFSVSDYDRNQTARHHEKKGAHQYLICNTVLASALFINVPKIKTHQKAGISAALKNLIGINGDKSWIPHYRIGSVASGGDEYSNDGRLVKYIYSTSRRLAQGRSRWLWSIGKFVFNRAVAPCLLKKNRAAKCAETHPAHHPVVTDGAWYGNDTLWRVILDLNRILFLTNADGCMCKVAQRRCLCLGDGIIVGEGDGPLNAQPRHVGLLTLTENPLAHDMVCAQLMGFDWRKIPQLAKGVEIQNELGWNVNKGAQKVNSLFNGKWSTRPLEQLPHFNCLPPVGWLGHMELRHDYR